MAHAKIPPRRRAHMNAGIVSGRFEKIPKTLFVPA